MRLTFAALLLALAACTPYTPLSPAGAVEYGRQLQSAGQIAMAETQAASQATQQAHIIAIEQQRAELQAEQTRQSMYATVTAGIFQAAQTQAAATIEAQKTQAAAERIATADAATATAQMVQATDDKAAYLALVESRERHERTMQTVITFGGIAILIVFWTLTRWWLVPVLQIKVDERRRKAELSALNGRTLVYVNYLGRWADLSELTNTSTRRALLSHNEPPPVVVHQTTDAERLIKDSIAVYGGDDDRIASFTTLSKAGYNWTSAQTWQDALNELKAGGMAIAEPTGSRCADGYTLAQVLDTL